MTPKEKAKELFDKYCWAIRIEETDSGYFSNVLYAKQCALIAVEQIQNLCWGNNQVGINHWNEVKQEIEKL